MLSLPLSLCGLRVIWLPPRGCDRCDPWQILLAAVEMIEPCSLPLLSQEKCCAYLGGLKRNRPPWNAEQLLSLDVIKLF